MLGRLRKDFGMALRTKRSPIWEFFNDPVDKKVECKQCEKKLVYTGGTTAIREHMKRAHPLLFGRCDREKSSAKQSSMLQHVAVKPAATVHVGTSTLMHIYIMWPGLCEP